MTKLSKAQLVDWDAHQQKLTDCRDTLESGLGKFNAAIQGLWEEHVTPALEAYNEALADASEFTGGIASDIQDYIGERSEAWQNGERGQAFTSWAEEWENITLDDVSLEPPAELDLSDVNDHAEDLGQLSEEPS